MEFRTHPVSVLPLSREDARSLVKTSFKNGEEWLRKRRPFDILLDTVRGNPRALWVLKGVLDERDPKLPFDVIKVMESLIKPIEETFRMVDDWRSVEEGLLTLLFAIIGIPVFHDEVLAQPGSKTPATARDFQLAGLVTGRAAPHPSPLWIKHWSLEGKVLLEIPLLLALASVIGLRSSMKDHHSGNLLYSHFIKKQVLTFLSKDVWNLCVEFERFLWPFVQSQVEQTGFEELVIKVHLLLFLLILFLISSLTHRLVG